MLLLGIDVVVGEVGIERIVERNFGVGVGGGLPGFLGGEDGGVGAVGIGWLVFLAGSGKRAGPVVAIAADGADDLLSRDHLHDVAEVVLKPILACDRTRDRAGLMLPVVHQDEAVGVGGEELEVELAGVDGNVDVELEVVLLEVGIKRLGEQAIGGLGIGREGLEVERQATIAGVGGEELVDLLNEICAGFGAEKELLYIGVEGACERAEVVDHREDFGIFAGGLDGAEDLILAVDAVDAGGVDDGEGSVVGGKGGERTVGREDVQPLGKEDVDLLDVRLEGGVAGGVEVGVEGGAQAFALVEGYVGGLEIGLAMG